jgi:hypothetical protein
VNSFPPGCQLTFCSLGIVYEIPVNGNYGKDDPTIVNRHEGQRCLAACRMEQPFCASVDQGQEEGEWDRSSGQLCEQASLRSTVLRRSGQGRPRCVMRVFVVSILNIDLRCRMFRALSKSQADGPKPEQPLQNPRMAAFLRSTPSAHSDDPGMGTHGIYGLRYRAVAFTYGFIGQYGASSRVSKGRLRGALSARKPGIPLISNHVLGIRQILDKQRRGNSTAQVDSPELASAVQFVVGTDRACADADADRFTKLEARRSGPRP